MIARSTRPPTAPMAHPGCTPSWPTGHRLGRQAGGPAHAPAGLEGRCRRRRRTTIVRPAASRGPGPHQTPLRPLAPDSTPATWATSPTSATWDGFAYLATVIDLASRRVVGWAVADHMRTELVCDALAHGPRARGGQRAAIMFIPIMPRFALSRGIVVWPVLAGVCLTDFSA